MREKTAGIRKKMMAVLLAVMTIGSSFIGNWTPVYASMADEAIDYTMGETYRVYTDSDSVYYCFTLTHKSHISLNVKGNNCEPSFEILGTNGKLYMRPDNVSYKENVTTEVHTGKASRTLAAGTYYLNTWSGWERREYYFNLQAEDLITLSKGAISSMKSKKSGQLTVTSKSVKNAIGYKIQYSTDYRFKKGVKTVYSPTRTKTLTKLSKGKRYYVKVTPYTVYSDGVYAWGGTSYVKAAVVKK